MRECSNQFKLLSQPSFLMYRILETFVNIIIKSKFDDNYSPYVVLLKEKKDMFGKALNAKVTFGLFILLEVTRYHLLSNWVSIFLSFFFETLHYLDQNKSILWLYSIVCIWNWIFLDTSDRLYGHFSCCHIHDACFGFYLGIGHLGLELVYFWGFRVLGIWG